MATAPTHTADDLVERLFSAGAEALDLASVYLGERLGLYEQLSRAGEANSGELAARSELQERPVREWLEQQAVTGLVVVDEPGAPAEERRYSLPAGHAEVLLELDSPYYLGSYARCLRSAFTMLPEVMDSFRTGAGVPYERYGADFRDGLGLCNRAAFLNLLGSTWLPSITDVDARLRAQPPARVADLACGTGWSTIAIARAYPNVRVDGIDLDPSSIEVARQNLAASDVDDRVTFSVGDASDDGRRGGYDLVTIFEALHDMSDPVGALRSANAMLGPGGTVLVVDERADERFGVPGDDLQRTLYGFSIVHCLHVGMAQPDSACTGTVMRPVTLHRYARDAGFTDMQVLDIDHDMWRFYRLVP